MRRLVLVLAASLLTGGVYTPDIGPGPLGYDQAGGWNTVWYMPLSSNGVTGASDLPSGFPAPTIAWFGWDPLVNHGSAGGTFAVEDGATDAENTPFCPDGDFSDLTDSGDPATHSCLQARYFDANDSYVLSDYAVGAPTTTDYSICAIFRNETASNGVTGYADTVTDHGVDIWMSASAPQLSWIHSVAHQTESVAKTSLGNWIITCGSGDYDGNIMIIANNDTSGGTTASSAGDFTTSGEGFSVGKVHGIAPNFTGAILAVYAWPTTALTAAQIKQFTDFWWGVLPTNEYIPDTTTTAGPTCYWFDEKLSCYADDFLVIGGQIPPGLTGAGSSGGFVTIDSLTNMLLNSRDLSASWVETGTVIGATSTANSPFQAATYFPVTLLEDNDAGAAEYISQTVNMTAFATGNKLLLSIYARSGAGNTGLDFRISEGVGGVGGCTAADTDYTALALTESWSTYNQVYTILDGDCTDLTVSVGPVSASGAHDYLTVGETGTMYGLFQLIQFQSSASINYGNAYPTYVESGSAAAGVGGLTHLKWQNNSYAAAAFQDSATDVSKFEITVTPPSSTPGYSGNTTYHVLINDGAGGGAIRMSTIGNGNVNRSFSSGLNTGAIAVPGWVGGTSTVLGSYHNWGSDIYLTFQDYTLKDTDTTADSPGAGVDSLWIGCSISWGSGAGFLLKNFKFQRKR